MQKSISSVHYIMLSALSLFSLCASLKISAQGNLLITPKRVVFDGSKKSYALNLANIGQDTARYDISLIHYRMKDDGSLEKITQPDSSQKFADGYLRFFPHNVVLAPNSSQTVRVQVTKWNELEPGEYRSNLYFKAVQTEKSFEEKKPGKDSGISIKVIPVIGISMPVIIQAGESNAKVSFSNAAIQIVKDTVAVIKATFNRTGNMSVYGDISVDYISPQGKVIRVGLVKGIAVYTPNPIRNFSFRLNNIHGVNYHTGKLHIVYYNQALPTMFAETEIILH
ncbi:MAG: hypothetical protein JWN83_1499 [Chitinophagaceae bacterium]|nr:hypothetical protein [Chitinophagaceae bacterium]